VSSRSSFAAFIFLASLLAPSCAPFNEAAGIRAPDGHNRGEHALSPPTALADSTIEIAESIRDACDLGGREDLYRHISATIHQSYRELLARVAECFRDGTVAGEDLEVVSRAGAPGSGPYSRRVGNRRSDNKKSILVPEGMSAHQIQVSLREELDATRSDEARWEGDRRVDAVPGRILPPRSRWGASHAACLAGGGRHHGAIETDASWQGRRTSD
jgi:hypothetical protein